MRNRWYSPDLRQFLTHDPLGAIDSHNLYAYVAMDPINGWDPYGLRNRSMVDQSPLQRRMLGSPLADQEAFGNQERPEIYNGRQYGFPTTKAVAKFVAVESVGALYGGPFNWLTRRLYLAGRTTPLIGPVLQGGERLAARGVEKGGELVQRLRRPAC